MRLSRHILRSILPLFLWAFAFFLSCTPSQVAYIDILHDVVSADEGSMFIKVRATGSWKLTAEFPGGGEPWASVSVVNGVGDRNDIILQYDANGTGERRSMDLVLAYEGGVSRKAFSQISESALLPEDGNFPGLKSDRLAMWAELPAVQSGPGFAWVCHDMERAGKRVRNYSFLFDARNKISLWVAYPLNRGLIGKGGRTDAWAYDPKVPEQYQADVMSGFGGGYDRGHQMPSADRLEVNSNKATFYATNMTPQRGRYFNQDIWMHMEEQVRSWAYRCDTLYVVTGCVPGDRTIKNGVNIPAAYYKALMRFSKGSSTPYLGVAFWFENKDYSESYPSMRHAMTIDALEEKLGMDFFVNVPQPSQEAAEATIDSWWDLN